ncbi:MAG: hypothetical protein KAU28_00570, partial [Phycisphaerae bacterium]|nr:hypothetical protein [Phycisphaerae bacterium]
MSYRRFHWLEKFQVQLATVGALALVYFGVWHLIRPGEPMEPVVFVPGANAAGAGVFVAMVLFLSVVCALLTPASRPEGATAAALIGAMGVSLRSAPIRSLLWLRQDSLRWLFAELILEVLLLVVVLLLSAVIVGLVRWAMAAIRPKWLWKDPLADMLGERREKPGLAAIDRRILFGDILIMVVSAGGSIFRRFRSKGADRAGEGKPSREMLLRSAACMVLGVLVAVTLLVLIMQSTDRGQVIFAILISFLLASLIAYQLIP